jgi:cytochrome c biogenesis protein CcdA
VAIIMADRFSGGADAVGIVMCVLGVVALTVATLTVKSASSDGGNLLMVVGLQLMVGSIALLPPALILETIEVSWSWELVAAFIYTTLMPGLIATFIWFKLVGRIGSTRAATFHFLNPVFGVAIAAALLGERLSWWDVVGVVVITLGILAVQLSRVRPESGRHPLYAPPYTRPCIRDRAAHGHLTASFDDKSPRLPQVRAMELIFAYGAGLLTLINPCVLPVLPIVLAGSMQASRYGPLALAAGMGVAFVTLGFGVIAAGHLVGLTPEMVAQAGAVLMIVFGLVLMVPRLSSQFALATAGVSERADGGMQGLGRTRLAGQFLGRHAAGRDLEPLCRPDAGRRHRARQPGGGAVSRLPYHGRLRAGDRHADGRAGLRRAIVLPESNGRAAPVRPEIPRHPWRRIPFRRRGDPAALAPHGRGLAAGSPSDLAAGPVGRALTLPEDDMTRRELFLGASMLALVPLAAQAQEMLTYTPGLPQERLAAGETVLHRRLGAVVQHLPGAGPRDRRSARHEPRL